MGKAKKIIIGVLVTALVGTGIGGGLLYVRKGSQKEVLVASVSDLAGERYDSDATLSGTVYANATQEDFRRERHDHPGSLCEQRG